MSDLLKKIELLEREIEQLTEERRFAMSTLDMAANLLTFDTLPTGQNEIEQVLDETTCKILSMLNFEALCFYLIDESDASFSAVYSEPEEFAGEIEARVDRLIDDQTFAWALGRNKPVRIEENDTEPPLLLHSIATASRARGMFIGVPIEGGDEYESPLPLLTLVLHSCASIIESIEIYRHMRQQNQLLEQKIAQLEHNKTS